METSVKIDSNTTIEVTAYYDGMLKTHDCNVGVWRDNDICSEIDFKKVLDDAGMPKGKYKVTLTLEKID